jgi:hypothetical protein
VAVDRLVDPISEMLRFSEAPFLPLAFTRCGRASCTVETEVTSQSRPEFWSLASVTFAAWTVLNTYVETHLMNALCWRRDAPRAWHVLSQAQALRNTNLKRTKKS